MAKPDTIGNRIAPPRFLAFMAALIVGVPVCHELLGNWALGFMGGFDLAAFVFLLSSISLLGTHEARVIRDHAAQNDANRHLLLGITGTVISVLLIAIAAESVGHN